ncbi:putative esterase/lipase [Exophiala dermatitidis]
MKPTQSTSHPYILHTPRGSLQGVEHRDASTNKQILYRFTKVPYALPPVGPLRWRRPQSLPADFTFNTKNNEPGDYTEFGPVCPQPHYAHDLAYVDPPPPGAVQPIETAQDEDCLYLNIWVPAEGCPGSELKPATGWPVQFFLHGGWLQIGNAMQSHDHDPFDLLANTAPRIVVSPTYRLNVFGFLAGEDLASLHEDPAPSNYGFWDQRCALEWTAQHIGLFGGDPNNITVGGLSAGANSSFFQLNYDSQLGQSQSGQQSAVAHDGAPTAPAPASASASPTTTSSSTSFSDRRLIRRIFLWSNAVAIQPNSSTSAILTSQFNELCSVLGIDVSSSTTPAQKMAALRAIPASDLVAALSKLKMHTFRASTDGEFIRPTFLASLHSGTFATRLSRNQTSILLGEVSDEKELYKLVNPPRNHAELLTQLANYYPPAVVEALLPLYKLPSTNDGDEAAWAEVFSQMVADAQVHASQRGLVHVLVNPDEKKPGVLPLPLSKVHRYRIAWRAQALDNWLKPEVKVCHSADIPIWWASGWRYDFSEQDKTVIKKFLKPFAQFLYGEDRVYWPCTAENRLRLLDRDGTIREDVEDELWERGLEIWNAVWKAQKPIVASE